MNAREWEFTGPWDVHLSTPHLLWPLPLTLKSPSRPETIKSQPVNSINTEAAQVCICPNKDLWQVT